MDLIAIPLIIIMSLAIIFYTISVFGSMARGQVSKVNMGLMHLSILLVIIGLFYMSGISSKLSYTYTSYNLMYIHQGLGAIATIVLIIHGIILTITRRKSKKTFFSVKKSFNVTSFILWLICIIFYLITLYIGILASIK